MPFPLPRPYYLSFRRGPALAQRHWGNGAPEQSTYRFIIVAAKRARQLQGGARPVLPPSSKKQTVIAMEEVRRGLVKYSLTGQVPAPMPVEPVE